LSAENKDELIKNLRVDGIEAHFRPGNSEVVYLIVKMQFFTGAFGDARDLLDAVTAVEALVQRGRGDDE